MPGRKILKIEQLPHIIENECTHLTISQKTQHTCGAALLVYKSQELKIKDSPAPRQLIWTDWVFLPKHLSNKAASEMHLLNTILPRHEHAKQFSLSFSKLHCGITQNRHWHIKHIFLYQRIQAMKYCSKNNTLGKALSKWSIISHFSFVSSTCLLVKGSRILIFTSNFPPTDFLPSVNYRKIRNNKNWYQLIALYFFKLTTVQRYVNESGSLSTCIMTFCTYVNAFMYCALCF